MLNREPTPSNIPAQRPFPFHASRDSPLSACAHFIIYQEDVRVPQPKYDMAELKSLPVAWLWESIINFKLIDPVLFDSQQTCGY